MDMALDNVPFGLAQLLYAYLHLTQNLQTVSREG